ncbi:hypothetical protein, partial [Corynebacterium matruchotii]|uniref:hypothetical protein n=1 Tax=Corynebacterium matruchotii TaxID=43768 RepID=UPI0036721FE9
MGELVCGFRQIRSHELIPRIVLARPICDDVRCRRRSGRTSLKGQLGLAGHSGPNTGRSAASRRVWFAWRP